MNKIYFILLLAFVSFGSAFGQKEFDKWTFGKNAGIDFASGTAVAMTSTCNGWDNTASIADSAGNLLFQSDGNAIYDRTGAVMPNGSNVLGDTGAGAPATIVRKPGSTHLYYVFTLAGESRSYGCRYTVVDMNLNGGLGDVDTSLKSILVFTPVPDKIVPIVHANGYDVWILIHEWNSNTYRSYLLTANGLQTNYVASTIGSTVGGTYINSLGSLTVSNAGDRIASALFGNGTIDVANFNKTSGVVSNNITIPDTTSVLGVEFSPDGSKLYASHYEGPNLTQYDLSTFDLPHISASKIDVGIVPLTWGYYYGGFLTPGPDGKIYVSVTFSHYVGAIDSPNLAGLACHFNVNEVNLGAGVIEVGMVDRIAVTPVNYTVQVNLASGRTVCNGSYIILDPHVTAGVPPFVYSWTATGNTLSCGNCKNPSVTITQNSTFVLTVTDANGKTAVDTVSYPVSGTTSTLNLALVIPNNIDCSHPVDTTYANVTNGVLPVDFFWGDGLSQLGSLSELHTYSQLGIYVISVIDSAGCVNSAFDTVLNNGIAVTLVNARQPICYGDTSGQLFVTVSGGTSPYSFVWSNGSSADSLANVPGGSYSVTVTDISSCSSVFNYNLNPANDIGGYYVYMTPTDANCSNNGSIVTNIYDGIQPYHYRWSTGDSSQNLLHLGTGTYTLTVTDSAGCARKGSASINRYCASIISGYVFIDSNANCIIDSNEYLVSYAGVSASTGGLYYYGTTDWTGQYTIVVPDTGTYYLQEYGADGYCANFSICGNPTQNVTISVLGDSSLNNNFAEAFSTGFDLTTHPGWTSADPGFQKEYWIMPYNQSSVPFTGLYTLTFTYDSNLVYQYSLPPIPVHDPVNHTLTWSMDTTLPFPWFDWYGYRFENFFQVPVSLSLGLLLQSDFYITPTTGDCDSSNNRLHFSETVIGSHDPNEKSVYPSGYIHPEDTVLQYTIHFQNTGTDSTWFIVVKDTLSPNLDPGSVKNLASSHPYSDFSVSGKGILTWTFNPLRLVDSLTNARGSQGFVTFSVKVKKNLAPGATISNQATIYFDYNEGVVTNRVYDTVAIATAIKQPDIAQNISVKAYPNPFSNLTHIQVDGLKGKYDFELFDVTGRLKKRITSIESSQFELMRDDLAAGMYFYRISVAAKQAAYGKLIVQ